MDVKWNFSDDLIIPPPPHLRLKTRGISAQFSIRRFEAGKSAKEETLLSSAVLDLSLNGRPRFPLETLSWMHTNFFHSFRSLSVETSFSRGRVLSRSKEAMTGQRIGGKRRVHPLLPSFSPIRS